MASFPILRQKDVMDCGPTCLAMICKYYGKSYGVDIFVICVSLQMKEFLYMV